MTGRAARPLAERVRLLWRIWTSYAVVRFRLARLPLPAAVASLSPPARSAAPSATPRAQGRMVWRRLRVATWRPPCLARALVLYRMLALTGTPAVVVIGLPEQARTPEAHAWVEIDGVDVGPPPGRNGHVELVRFGAPTSSDPTDSSRS